MTHDRQPTSLLAVRALRGAGLRASARLPGLLLALRLP
jgi:hypothetical protein